MLHFTLKSLKIRKKNKLSLCKNSAKNHLRDDDDKNMCEFSDDVTF